MACLCTTFSPVHPRRQPALTTVKQDFYAIGVEMVNLIDRQIKGETENLHLMIPTELMVRATTAPPQR